jgi:two-component system, NarL family, sensor histidine kinase UhpB
VLGRRLLDLVASVASGALRRSLGKRADEQSHFQSQILAQVNDAVVAIDKDKRVIFWGHGAELLYGIPAREALGKGIRELYLLRWPSPTGNADYEKSMAERGSYRGELIHVLPSGREIHVESSAAVLRDAQGRELGRLGVVRDVTERKRAEEHLRQSGEELRALTARLQSIREEEQTRIARDLHDELGQLLTALKMGLRSLETTVGAIDPQNVNGVLDRVVAASETVDQTLTTIRRIATELRPGSLDRLGLVPALRQELRRFEEQTGIKCKAFLPDQVPELDPEVAIALYRICQEAMTNVHRHAGASRVAIRLEVDPGRITLQVEDDGRGFEPAVMGSPHALGLLGMVERAEALDGHVHFQRAQGQGTLVTASIPLGARLDGGQRFAGAAP